MSWTATPTDSLLSQWPAGQGSAMWTGSSQPGVRLIPQLDFTCLLQFPENKARFTSAHKAPDTPCAPASPTGKKMRCFLVNLPPDSCASLLLPHTGGQASTVSSWTVISILRLTECLQHCRNAQQKCNDYSYLIGKTAHISLLEIIFSGDPFKT